MLGPGISREPPIEEHEEEPVEEEELSAPELRLEEEEPAKVEVEEEAVAAEAVAPQPARPGVIRLFGHELEEVAVGEVSTLKCVKCRVEVPLTEAPALRERPCSPAAQGGGFCKACGKTGITGNYCEECARGVEDYGVIAKPLVEYQKRLVKVQPPEAPPADGWAWVGEVKTFFPFLVREGGRVWPCPACGRVFGRLVDMMEHFAAAHPERTGGFEKVFDVKTKMDYWRSWQGYVCPDCGRLMDPAKHRCGEER